MFKTITILTNYNKKLACNAFVHIDLAPENPIPEKALLETVIEIRTKDDSYPPVRAKLMDICRIQLDQVRDAFTYPSHGVNAYEYYNWFYDQIPEAQPETKLAVYFYKKIEE